MSKILLSGGSGFLGKVICNVLPKEVQTIGRRNADIVCDLSKTIPALPGLFDVVVHAAGKAHIVPKTESEKQAFYDVNVTGTRNLLYGLEKDCLPKSFVFISTVGVYGLEKGRYIKETSPLIAKDPYGHSKIQAEILIQEWCAQHNVICSILRLPLIAGATPPGNLGAMINGLQRGYYFDIAGGTARKSVVLAEDVARILPKASEVGGIYNLTDGHHPSFSELSKLVAKQLGKDKPANIPYWLARCIARVGDLMGARAPINTNKLKKIISDLTFDDTKAREALEWRPIPVLEGFKIK